MRVKWSTETFVQKLMSVFGDDYVYNFAEYKNSHEKVLMYCKIHGFFYSIAGDLLRGHGCKKCNKPKGGYAKRDSFEEVVEKIKSKHGDKYEIPIQNYVNDRTPIKLICPIHGEFFSKPMQLKNGCGCQKCGKMLAKDKKSMNNEEFVKKFLKKYGYEKYDTSKTDLKNRDENGKVIFICHEKFKNGKEHGEFLMTPNNMLSLHGCPHCKQSRLEHKMETILINNDIEYIYQCNRKYFKWLGCQSLDFYLPKYNIAIECQGGGHFLPIQQFGGDAALKKQIELDERKKLLCEKNNVKIMYCTNLRKYIDNETIFDVDNIIDSIRKLYVLADAK